MGQILGLVTAAAQLGLESILVTPTRYIGPFFAQVTLEEQHQDELEITDHPVETGARITDHAYMRPSELTIHCAWSNSPSIGGQGGILGLAQGVIGAVTQTISGVASLLSGSATTQVQQMYENLLDLQRRRIPFDVATGKRVYNNMLVKSLRVTTNKETENALDVTAVFRQIVIVRTQVVTVAAPKTAQADPGKTSPQTDKGTKALTPGNNYNAGAGRGAINPGTP